MSEFVQKEKAEGIWNGEQIKFTREYSGHRFTDDEVIRLLNGETITVNDFQGKTGPYSASGKLERQEYNGRQYVGFKIQREPREYQEQSLPAAWCEHQFTEEEKEILNNGGTVWISGCVSKKGSTFSAEVAWTEENGRKRIVPINFGN